MNFIIVAMMSLITLLCPDFEPGYFFAQNDIDLMARVVMSEASTQSFDCKQAVASALLNRYYSDEYPNDISRLIKGQFSTQDNGKPTDECYEAVYAAIAFRDAFPEDMYYFRDTHFHTFGHPLYKIDDLYFSTKYEQVIPEGAVFDYD